MEYFTKHECQGILGRIFGHNFHRISFGWGVEILGPCRRCGWQPDTENQNAQVLEYLKVKDQLSKAEMKIFELQSNRIESRAVK